MNTAKDFTFFDVRKILPPGEYEAVIKDFRTFEKTSKAGNKYFALTADIQINNEMYELNLSLSPYKGNLKKLIDQLSEKTQKSIEDIVQLCSNPVDFFEFAKDKNIKVISTEKKYFDVWPVSEIDGSEDINPKDIPF